jgi:hypothetical protein
MKRRKYKPSFASTFAKASADRKAMADKKVTPAGQFQLGHNKGDKKMTS